jgi:hypothetical protein
MDTIWGQLRGKGVTGWLQPQTPAARPSLAFLDFHGVSAKRASFVDGLTLVDTVRDSR